MTRRIVLVLFLLSGTVAVGEELQSPPALTELQKKDILLAVKDVEIWQLRAQQAASEYQKASEAMQKLVAAATPPGYRLNERLDLVKIEPTNGK